VGAVLEHVVGGGEDGSGDGDNGLLWTTPGAEAQVLSGEVTSLFARGRPGALDKGGLEPGRAFFYAVGAAFSGAFVVFGAESGPSDQLGSGGEAAPVDADLRYDHSAERLLRPGMVLSISMATRKGSTLASTS
jgi:hypothetical protein